MPDTMIGLVPLLILAILVVGAAAYAGGYFVKSRRITLDERSARLDAEHILDEARQQQRELVLEARDEALSIKTEAEQELRDRRSEVRGQERRIQQREEALDRRIETADRREGTLARREQESEALRQNLQSLEAQSKGELSALKNQRITELERISHLSVAEAKEQMLEEVDSEVRIDANRLVREAQQRAKEESDALARKIVLLSVQRCTADLVAESTVSVVPLPNEEMKGRIIGREGRNIRAMEGLTGVDVIIDDTPNAVTLSAFDPIRREIARIAMQRLVSDGRIHPARIEDVVRSAQEDVDRTIREEGDAAAVRAGVHGLHAEVLRMLGRLRFRTSYGQNILYHSVEVAHICSVVASEIGADVTVARASGLLHDLGKALSQEVEGPHAIIGADFLQRFVRSPKIIAAVGNHHDELEEPQSLEAIIVQVADAISGARPGARRETVENYVKRLEALETVANSFDGVNKSFAIQAGREVRIIVEPDQIDDLSAVRMARDIGRKIEETLEYPGQIKITVMRETRAVDYAR